jgi:hypothetical protein
MPKEQATQAPTKSFGKQAALAAGKIGGQRFATCGQFKWKFTGETFGFHLENETNIVFFPHFTLYTNN